MVAAHVKIQGVDHGAYPKTVNDVAQRPLGVWLRARAPAAACISAVAGISDFRSNRCGR